MPNDDVPLKMTRCTLKAFGETDGDEINISRDALNAHLVIRSHGTGRSTTTEVHHAFRVEDRVLTGTAAKKQESTESRRNEKKGACREKIMRRTEGEKLWRTTGRRSPARETPVRGHRCRSNPRAGREKLTPGSRDGGQDNPTPRERTRRSMRAAG